MKMLKPTKDWSDVVGEAGTWDEYTDINVCVCIYIYIFIYDIYRKCDTIIINFCDFS